MTDKRAGLEARKLDKFRALVRHAGAHSPYYANIIHERAIDIDTCVPSDFPVLTKSLLMANFDAIVTDRRITRQVVTDFLAHSSDPRDRLFDEITVTRSSGTSGEFGYFLYTPADFKRMNADRRRSVKALLGFLRGRRKPLRRISVAFYGATGGHYGGVTSLVNLQRGFMRLLVRTGAFEVNTPLPPVVEALNVFHPDVLLGYTTALKMLAAEQRAGRLRISPIAVIASGEVTTKSDVSLLSEAFTRAWTLNAYACSEHLGMGYSNPDGDTMTLADDNLIFELYDDHTVITNLFNFTMPMIRYRMSDILVPVSPPGAHPIVIKTVVGRSELLPTFRNSAGATDFLSAHTIGVILVKGVTRFQMQITGPESFRFPFCVEDGMDERERAAAVAGVKARLTEILVQKGLGNVTFETPIVEDIALNAQTRKFQLIVDQQRRPGEPGEAS